MRIANGGDPPEQDSNAPAEEAASEPKDESSSSSFLAEIRKSLDAYFDIQKRGSTFTVEIVAGITTFLSMAYILTVNPAQLCPGQGNDKNFVERWPSAFIATCAGTVLGTLLMALHAKMPYALAPGMGLNSAIGVLIAYGDGAGHVWSYDNAMALVFIYALVVLFVTVVPVGRDPETHEFVPFRERLYDNIPPAVRDAIPAGIGLFLAFLGMHESQLI
jgi:AGZA family xanthine/uracil permease-like MFS transporter